MFRMSCRVVVPLLLFFWLNNLNMFQVQLYIKIMAHLHFLKIFFSLTLQSENRSEHNHRRLPYRFVIMIDTWALTVCDACDSMKRMRQWATPGSAVCARCFFMTARWWLYVWIMRKSERLHCRVFDTSDRSLATTQTVSLWTYDWTACTHPDNACCNNY